MTDPRRPPTDEPLSASDRRRLERFVDELVAAAGVLDHVDEAPVAEAWASGAVAEWIELGGRPGQLGDRIGPASPLAGRLVDWLEGAPTPSDATPAVVDDPPWVTDVGTSVPLAALEVRDVDGERAVIIEYRAHSGARHDVSVSFDRDGSLIDLSVGPPGLAEAADDSEEAGFATSRLPVEEACERVRAGLADVGPDRLSDAARLNLPLLLRRFGLGSAVPIRPAPDAVAPARDAEDDRYAAELVASALRIDDIHSPPDDVIAAADAFADRYGEGDPDVASVVEVGGMGSAFTAGVDSFLAAVAAYLAPVDLTVHPVEERAPIAALEPADWVGVVLGAVRDAGATPIDGETCVRWVNRCPEITTTIPRRDAPAVAWAFDRVLYAWEVTGVIDAEGRLTPAGVWALPRAAMAVWRRSG